MSHENTDVPISANMRRAAFAAPSAVMERQELDAAYQQERKERIAGLGGSASLVLDLERQLQVVDDERRRAVNEARYATGKLEQMHKSMSAILGRDTRQLGMVRLATAMSDSKFKLTKLADYIDKALTLDDLASLKRIASNMGVIQPQTITQSMGLMGLTAGGAA